MAHMRLYHKETGVHVDVWSVDAKELLASGEYAVENPHTGMQEGVPGETVMRPFDPTMHREDPGSRPGDVVVTAPPRGADEATTSTRVAPAPTQMPQPGPHSGGTQASHSMPTPDTPTTESSRRK